jgi:hypothetical protein
MKAWLFALICALLVATGAFARAPQHNEATFPAQPDESQLIEHRQYRNQSGAEVHSPAHTKDGKKPNGATAKCRDGSWSFSQHHRGTCSHHGGVSQWLE